jgi:endonuclease-3
VRRLKKRWQGREDLRKKARKITHLLEKQYGVPRREVRADPLDTLIQTILSQNTNDLNRDRAFQRLKTRFPHWADVLNANTKDLTQAIRPAGLANQKARRICEILRWIQKHHGKLSLSFLQAMDSEEIKKTLGGLKGVGPKTTHCLLLFGMGREAFPVDTHVLRVGKHLGFIPVRMDAKKAHQWVAPLVPKGKSLSLHLNLIRFGRSVCKAKKPHCHICFLIKECVDSIQQLESRKRIFKRRGESLFILRSTG